MSEQQILRIEDPASPGASIVCDTRHFPLIVQAWIGQPSLEMAKSYFELRRAMFFERARMEKTKVFIVADLSKLSSPSAIVRKYIGDTAKIEDDRDELLGYVSVVPSAIMRGVVTALKWIIGDDVKPITLASSMEEGFARARQVLESNDISVPPFTYAAPY